MRIIFSRLALTLAILTSSTAAGLANEALKTLTDDANAWAMQLGDYGATRYSTLAGINRTNVKEMVPAWTFSTGVLRGHEGSPLVVGDTMFVHTPFPNIVYALDLKNEGMIKWKFEPVQDPSVIAVMCCDTVNRGVAYAPAANGNPALVILAQADTTVVALDAGTGEIVWSVRNGDPTKGETSTAAPLVVNDKVLIGNAGGEFGVRGHLTAYSLKDGAQVWRAYTTGPDADMLVDPEKTTSLGKPIGPDSSLKTWQGDQWKIGGGTTWGWFSFDPETNTIFYGTGNPSTWNPAQRPGDNKWSTSIFARDADTGVARWVYQLTPHDEWDYDSTNEMILTDVDVEGVSRKALVHFGRNGFAYTIDRTTGELLVARKYDPAVNWASEIVMDKTSPDYGRPVLDPRYSTEANGEDTNTSGICPAALGTKDQQPASYSPKTRLFYVPTNHVCMDYEPFRVAYSAGHPYVGSTVSMYPAPESHGGMGNFVAWDAGTGRLVWSLPEQFSVWSGALATAGDVVFYGTLEGYLKAVDATTGEELYRFKTASGIIGNVMTYVSGGQQYVAVLSGIGGWAGIGLAAGLTGENAGLGASGGYASLGKYTALGGQLTVFTVPNQSASAQSAAK